MKEAWRRLEIHTEFWFGNIKRKNQMRDLGVDGRLLMKLILKERVCEGVAWIQVGQVRDQWRALVNTVMNFHVP
jgi:hypothetical protein